MASKIIMTLAGLVSAWPACCQVQQVEVGKPKPIVAAPVAQPEPVAPVMEAPLTVFQGLISSSSVQRRRAIVDLGWKADEQFADDPNFIHNARLYHVNLDDDPDYEAIMTVDIGGERETRALIFKKSENKWWQVGSFSLKYMWTPDAAEHMVELRNIVDFDHKDIIIRLTGGGSGIQKEVGLSIYRLYQGRLYRTFKATEEFALREFPSPGVMMIEDEVHRLDYPDLDRAKGAFIVLHGSKSSVTASEWGLREPQPQGIDCLPYRWDSSKYTFVADPNASAKFCQAAPGPRKQTRE